MRAYLANKIFSTISGVLSLVILGTCGWILTSLLITKYRTNCNMETSSGNRAKCSNYTDSESDTIVIEATPYRSGLTEFYTMKDSFQTIIIVCLSSVIVASLVQFVSSTIIVLSASYKIATRSRKIVVVLFFVMIVFLVCFAWPLAYKRDATGDEDDVHSVSTLNSAVHEFFHDFDFPLLFKDLTLYYIETFANIVFLFFYMIVTCCLLRCNDNHEFIV